MANRAKQEYVLECHECGFGVTKEGLPISRCPKCGSYAFEPVPQHGPIRTYSEVVDEYCRLHPGERMSRALACRLEVAFIERLARMIVAEGGALKIGAGVHSDLFDPLPRIKRYESIGQLRLF